MVRRLGSGCMGKTFHAVSFARLEGMLADLFGVKVSQGALANMLKRSHVPFAARKTDIVADRAAPMWWPVTRQEYVLRD